MATLKEFRRFASSESGMDTSLDKFSKALPAVLDSQPFERTIKLHTLTTDEGVCFLL